MLRRWIGPVLTAAGLLLLVVSLLANAIGQLALARALGIGGDPGFGTEQAAGTLLSLAVLAVGIWLWRRPSAGESSVVRSLAALLAGAVVIGGPLYVILKAVDASFRPVTWVRPCVQVRAVPSSAGSAGHVRLDYGLQVGNEGRLSVQIDSIWLGAYRDTTASSLIGDEIATIALRRWERVDSLTLRASASGRWRLRSGGRTTHSRSLILPPDALRPLYTFRGTVFFQHGDPARPAEVLLGPDWVANFTEECW